MNMPIMGTAASYVKNMALNHKWQERKENPNLPKEDPQITQLKETMERTKKGNQITSLQSKMLSGSSLSPDELDYLRENSPEDYEKAVKLEKERAQYKKELQQCASKEDVEKLNQRKLTEFSAKAKAISNNPNIPKSEKLELLRFEAMRMAGMMSEHAEFRKSKEYQELPEKTISDEHEKKPKVEKIAQEEAEPRKIDFEAANGVVEDIPQVTNETEVTAENVVEVSEVASLQVTADVAVAAKPTAQYYNGKGQPASPTPSGAQVAAIVSIKV